MRDGPSAPTVSNPRSDAPAIRRRPGADCPRPSLLPGPSRIPYHAPQPWTIHPSRIAGRRAGNPP